MSPAFLFGAVLVFISQMYVLKESSGERYSAPFFHVLCKLAGYNFKCRLQELKEERELIFMTIDFQEKMNQKLEEDFNKALEEMCVECHSMEEFESEMDKAFAKMAAEDKEEI